MTDDKPRNRQLGRGLSALLGEAPVNLPENQGAVPPRSGVTMAPVEFLSPSPLQPRRRFGEAEIEEMAESVRQRGILQPILVRRDPAAPGHYQIVAGERRWRAAQMAQLHEVPVLVNDLDDESVLEVALVENVQRQDLNPLEEAEGYRRLIDRFGHTQESLTRIVGKSRSHIANTLRLLSLPDGVRKYLENGEISAGHARALVGVEDAEALARKVVRSGLSVRQVERRVRRDRERATGGPRLPDKDPDTAALEQTLSNLLGLRVTIDFKDGAGRVTVRYESLDQLDELITRLSQPLQGPRSSPS